VLVSFADFPEALTSGRDETEALREAADCLSEAIAGRLKRGDVLPAPRSPRKGECVVAPEPAVALKVVLGKLAAEKGRGSAALIARTLGIDHKEARRMLDPTHPTRTERLVDALAVFGYLPLTTVYKPRTGASRVRRTTDPIVRRRAA
jgi:antitoxin HicB